MIGAIRNFERTRDEAVNHQSTTKVLKSLTQKANRFGDKGAEYGNL
jgi:hypothetical protein